MSVCSINKSLAPWDQQRKEAYEDPVGFAWQVLARMDTFIAPYSENGEICKNANQLRMQCTCRKAHSYVAYYAYHAKFDFQNFKTENCKFGEKCSFGHKCYRGHPGDVMRCVIMTMLKKNEEDTGRLTLMCIGHYPYGKKPNVKDFQVMYITPPDESQPHVNKSPGQLTVL